MRMVINRLNTFYVALKVLKCNVSAGNKSNGLLGNVNFKIDSRHFMLDASGKVSFHPIFIALFHKKKFLTEVFYSN